LSGKSQNGNIIQEEAFLCMVLRLKAEA
jgi:hypothetical protein